MARISAKNVELELPVGQLPEHAVVRDNPRQAVGGRMYDRGRRGLYVKALDGITLDLEDGDRLALVGHNGAGKSSLLRILSQVYLPTSGQLVIEGKVSAVLTTSIGFKSEATGYENVMLAGLLRGLTKKQVLEVMPDIEAFSELGDYLNLPIRTYSNGMKVRLGFAIATAVRAEILVIDEILGAGDAAFRKKARPRMMSVMEHARILALASHSKSMLRNVCNKALWLDHGQVRALGDVDEVLEAYTAHTETDNSVS